MRALLVVLVLWWALAIARADVPDSGRQDYTTGVAMLEAGNAAGAVPLLEHALAAREQQYGPTHARVWDSLIELGKAYRIIGDPRTEAVLLRSLAIVEAGGDPDSPPVGTSVSELGILYVGRQDYRRAAPLLERSLRISEKQFGLEHEEVQTDLTNLGLVYRELGDPRAEAILMRSLNLAVKLWGEHSEQAGRAADSLARLYVMRSEWVRAEPLLVRAHRNLIASVGEAHPNALAVANMLARVTVEKHDFEGAVRILERAVGFINPGDPKLQPVLVSLLSTSAMAVSAMGKHDDAIKVLKFAISIQDKLGGPDSPGRLSLLHDLGSELVQVGKLDLALTAMEEVLLRETKIHGAESPNHVISTVTVIEILSRKGDLAGAERRYRELEPLAERVLGKESAQYSVLVGNHGSILATLGRLDEAWPLLRLAAKRLERITSAALQTGTEAERLRYVGQLAPAVSVLTAFALDPRAPPTAVADALELTLSFKGRALDATAATAIAVRRAGPAEQKLLVELAAARSALGAGFYGGDSKAASLEARVEELERQLASSAKGVIEPATTLAAVRGVLPESAALVEIVLYQPFALKQGAASWGDERYVAYVLEHTGEPRQVELGDAATINRAVKVLLGALSNPSHDPRAAAREVDRLVMAKIRPLLHTHWLYISPDGALSAVPFHALIDEHGHFSIEDYAITALTSGRDLLRRPRVTRPGAPVVIGDPAFDVSSSAPNSDSRSSSGLGTISFPPLPGTGVEARSLGELFPGARVLTGAAASETALKKLAGPPILHLATHGFFLADSSGGASTSRGLQRTDTPAVGRENPLLRSGLAFAGANPRTGGDGEDGILTALEASGLDLDGTRLVVLSACETGLGALTGGDGVRGLGRAFVLAGAETTVTSMWKVSDDATRDLMIDYYRRLAAGGGRGEAMRQAQLAMLRAPATRHPYYWASFVVSGNAASLDGHPIRPTIARGPRGCSCNGSGANPASGAPILLVILFLLGRRPGRSRTRPVSAR